MRADVGLRTRLTEVHAVLSEAVTLRLAQEVLVDPPVHGLVGVSVAVTVVPGSITAIRQVEVSSLGRGDGMGCMCVEAAAITRMAVWLVVRPLAA